MRTEKWARQRGLVYTGMSERNPAELKLRLGSLRARGYEAFICSWPNDPLSRSGGGGASIFADKRWAYDQEAEGISKELAQIPARKVLAHEEFQMELEKIYKREEELNCRLAEIRLLQIGA